MKWTKKPCVRLFSLNLIGTILHIAIVFVIAATAIATAFSLGVLGNVSLAFNMSAPILLQFWLCFGIMAWAGTICGGPFALYYHFTDDERQPADARVLSHLIMFGYWICRSAIWLGCLASNNWYGVAFGFTLELDVILLGGALAFVGLLGWACYRIPKDCIERAKKELDQLDINV